jgi:hypothetical protein
LYYLKETMGGGGHRQEHLMPHGGDVYRPLLKRVNRLVMAVGKFAGRGSIFASASGP